MITAKYLVVAMIPKTLNAVKAYLDGNKYNGTHPSIMDWPPGAQISVLLKQCVIIFTNGMKGKHPSRSLFLKTT